MLEGVSASRRELAPYIDFSIWMEADLDVAEKRGLERDRLDHRDFWFEWQAAERPLLERDRPWTRAQMVVDGVPTLEHDPVRDVVSLK